MNDRELLSVLVPAYNAESFIHETLDSIRNQSFKRFRVYVSVDKSSDQTLAKCLDCAKLDSRFQVIESSSRLGWVENSNLLLSKINTPFAVFAFHDDILHPSYFEKTIKALETDKGAIVAYSDTLLTRVEGSKEHWAYLELENVENPVIRGIKILEQREKWWVPGRGVFRWSMAEKIKGFKTHQSGEFSADLPWIFHMSLYGSFVRIPETLCFKFLKPSSLSRSWDFNQISRYDVLSSCMRELWAADVATEIKLKIGSPLMNYLIKNYSAYKKYIDLKN